jgi:tetratricopeptide (TPR) repeat protein
MTQEPKILLFVKPDWHTATDDFVEKWSHLLGMGHDIWGHDVEKTAVLDDKSLAVFTGEASQALAVAERVRDALQEKIGADTFPVHMVIDSVPYFEDYQAALTHLEINWGEIHPGSDIHVSHSVRRLLERTQALTVFPSSDTDSDRLFYKVGRRQDGEKSGETLFHHHNELVKGTHPSCYYCSSKGHQTTNCPSKHLLDSNRSLEKLGYLSFEAINTLFGDYISSGRQHAVLETDSTGSLDERLSLAHEGFYGLKSIFQLPFFRNVWNARDESWDKVRESKIQKEGKGGVIWMGTDCLRVSNLVQAETFLTTSVEKHPEDYRPYCGLGFLNIEREDFLAARHHFIKALNCAETKPQKIFILFLICRLYDLEGYTAEASENLREILHINPTCVEAMYQKVIFQFRDGKRGDALSLLNKLIALDRRFFVQALIDPDLAPFTKNVYPELKALFLQAKDEAKGTILEAKTACRKAEELLHAKDQEEVESLWLQIAQLSRDDSFFGHLDVMHSGRMLITTARRGIQAKKNELFEQLHGLKRRIEKCLGFVKRYRYPSLIGPVRGKLLTLDRKIVETRNMADSEVPEMFKKSLDRPAAFSDELDNVESKLERLNTIQLAVLFVVKFLKKSLIFQGATLVLAIVLFPVAVHYANLLLPKYSIDPVQNVWKYQQGILIVGGICGALLAFLKTIQGLQKERGHLY